MELPERAMLAALDRRESCQSETVSQAAQAAREILDEEPVISRVEAIGARTVRHGDGTYESSAYHVFFKVGELEFRVTTLPNDNYSLAVYADGWRGVDALADLGEILLTPAPPEQSAQNTGLKGGELGWGPNGARRVPQL